MICPKCSRETDVKDSRHSPSRDLIRRRRLCVKCKYRFTTFEISIEKFNQIHNIYKNFDNYIKKTQRSFDKLFGELSLMQENKINYRKGKPNENTKQRS